MDALPFRIREHLTDLIGPSADTTQLKFLLAVSGGMDSMVMAHCFLSLGLNFGVAHFNFQLRGESSDLDEKLIRSFCDAYNIPFHCRKKDTDKAAKIKKSSIQETARELRYEFFGEIMKSDAYDYICTAHHANDNIETFFIHLLRGSGVKGLTGIPSRRDRILRPMLPVPKRVLQKYARNHQVKYREDETNRSDKYLRNYIRRHIIQPLENRDQTYLSGILKAMDHLNENQEFIDFQLKNFYETRVYNYTQDIRRITSLSETLQDPGQAYLLKMYLLSQGLYPDSLTDLFDSSHQWRTGTVYEGETVNAWYDRDQLWIIRDSFFTEWDKAYEVELALDSLIDLPGGDCIELSEKLSGSYSPDSFMVPVHIKTDSLPLKIRHWKPGDVIEQGAPPYFRKSLKKLFSDNQIPRPFKHRIYILTDNFDNIISVLGLVNNPRYTSTADPDLTIRYTSQLWFLLDANNDDG